MQVDVLIIDDASFAKERKNPRIILSYFQSLHQSGKQIIMSSDRPRDRWKCTATVEV
jgi:chromosomal replication initiation ATPase DnaA